MKGAFDRLSKISKGHSRAGSNTRESKLSGSRSKLSQLSTKIITGGKNLPHGKQFSDQGRLSVREEKVKMFAIAVNSSVLRSKAIGFK